jgi:chromosome segregation ATPase
MSGLGKPKKDSLLPDNIEQKIKDVQASILSSIQQKDELDKDISIKNTELKEVSSKVDSANIELERVLGAIETKQEDITKRETELTQKESALNVYATALAVKEKRINKYLGVFEKMKDVVIK